MATMTMTAELAAAFYAHCVRQPMPSMEVMWQEMNTILTEHTGGLNAAYQALCRGTKQPILLFQDAEPHLPCLQTHPSFRNLLAADHPLSQLFGGNVWMVDPTAGEMPAEYFKCAGTCAVCKRPWASKPGHFVRFMTLRTVCPIVAEWPRPRHRKAPAAAAAPPKEKEEKEEEEEEEKEKEKEKEKEPVVVADAPRQEKEEEKGTDDMEVVVEEGSILSLPTPAPVVGPGPEPAAVPTPTPARSYDMGTVATQWTERVSSPQSRSVMASARAAHVVQVVRDNRTFDAFCDLMLARAHDIKFFMTQAFRPERTAHTVMEFRRRITDPLVATLIDTATVSHADCDAMDVDVSNERLFRLTVRGEHPWQPDIEGHFYAVLYAPQGVRLTLHTAHGTPASAAGAGGVRPTLNVLVRRPSDITSNMDAGIVHLENLVVLEMENYRGQLTFETLRGGNDNAVFHVFGRTALASGLESSSSSAGVGNFCTQPTEVRLRLNAHEKARRERLMANLIAATPTAAPGEAAAAAATGADTWTARERALGVPLTPLPRIQALLTEASTPSAATAVAPAALQRVMRMVGDGFLQWRRLGTSDRLVFGPRSDVTTFNVVMRRDARGSPIVQCDDQAFRVRLQDGTFVLDVMPPLASASAADVHAYRELARRHFGQAPHVEPARPVADQMRTLSARLFGDACAFFSLQTDFGIPLLRSSTGGKRPAGAPAPHDERDAKRARTLADISPTITMEDDTTSGGAL